MNSDRYLPSEDAPAQDILISLKELGEKRIPGAPMYKRAAQEIEWLRAGLQSIVDQPAVGSREDVYEYNVQLAKYILNPS